jgi:hypothetical protein
VSDASFVEAEVDRLLQWLPDYSRRTVLTGIFRQAVALHRASGVEGYLGTEPGNSRVVSIMLKHIFLCATSRRRNLDLLIDNVPGLEKRGTWRGFDLDPLPAGRKQRLAWVKCSLDDLPVLEAILTDLDVWRAYKRMLQRIESVNRSDRPATLQRLSVLS